MILSDHVSMTGRIPASSLTVRVAKILRDAAGREFSNARIARELDVSPHQIGRYMKGTKSPNLEELDAICRIIGLDPMDVIRQASMTTGHPGQDKMLNGFTASDDGSGT